MIYVVFSLGQLVNSDLNKLKQGFTDYFTEKNINKTGEHVWAWMQADHLKSLRLGDMTVQNLWQAFNEHFETDIDFMTFSKIFNSMCIIDEASLARLASYKKFLEGHEGVQFVVVSHTNYSHLHFILSQIQPTLSNAVTIMNPTQDWDHNAKFILAPSMISKSEGHLGTLIYATQELNLSENDYIISCLNTIQVFEQHRNFSYSATDANQQNVIPEIERVLRLQAPAPASVVTL